VEPVFVPELAQLPELLAGVLEDGDVLLTLGAGDIGAAAQQLRGALAAARGAEAGA
jgi:UDP-N-acetylmuramate--alanine ligase